MSSWFSVTKPEMTYPAVVQSVSTGWTESVTPLYLGRCKFSFSIAERARCVAFERRPTIRAAWAIPYRYGTAGDHFDAVLKFRHIEP